MSSLPSKKQVVSKSQKPPGGAVVVVSTAAEAVDSGDEGDAKADVKQPVLTPAALRVMRTIAAASRGAKGERGIVKITLALAFNGTSAAATGTAPVVSVQPGTSTEFSLLAGTYDEVIVDSVDVAWRLYANTATQTSGFLAAVAYDPTNSGVYGAIVDVCVAKQHFGPVGCPPSTSGGVSVAPYAVTKDGMFHWRVKMPKGPAIHDPNVLSVVGTGNWTTTAVTTTTYGYLKFYIEAASAGTVAMNGIMRMNCRFRTRT